MVQSFKKNKKGILLMLMSAVLACCGQLLWKLSNENGILLLILGFVLYVVGAGTMLLAYRFGSVSVLQPIMSTSYIFSIFLGYFFLHESIYIGKIVGIISIIVGVILIVGGEE